MVIVRGFLPTIDSFVGSQLLGGGVRVSEEPKPFSARPYGELESSATGVTELDKSEAIFQSTSKAADYC